MRASALLLLFLAACQQDPYRVRTFDDDGGNGDGSWLDTQTLTDGPRHDGVTDATLPDLVGYDACLQLPEVCNNADDNCNNQIDEGFDKLTDPRYCESCKGCMDLLKLNAYPECVGGVCGIKSCMAGYEDLDPAQPGCEYPCTKTGVEICDGVDNDCNGKVDDGVTLTQNICKVAPNTPCAGATAVCKGAQGWQCVYSADVELQPCVVDADCGTGWKCFGGVCPGIVITDEKKCDGKDGDCDGVADDPWANPSLPNALGSDCDPDPTKLGICRPKGLWSCDTAGTAVTCKQTQAGKTATDELCNGLDDDCDGKVDEETGDAAGKGVVDAMFHVQRKVGTVNYNFYIYAHEASRPDASASAAGSSGARACSTKGVLPWASVTYAEAKAACVASGKRLCSGAEWVVACQGAGATLYPYGPAYLAPACNGVDATPGKPAATGSFTGCEGGESGMFDMSGNVREWTSEKRGTSGTKSVYVVRGGAYHTPAPGLICTFDLSQAVEDVVLPAIGFRCCSDTAP